MATIVRESISQLYNIGCAKFDFWDISGAQSTSQDRAKWMEDGDAAIIMVDLADRASIENATCWYKEIIPSQQDSQNSASIPVSIFSWKAYEKTDKRAISPTEISWSDGLYDIPFFYTTHLDLNEKANRIIADGIDRRPLGWILEQLTDEVNVEFPIVYSPDQSLHSCHDPDWLKHVAPEAYWMELPSDDDDITYIDFVFANRNLVCILNFRGGSLNVLRLGDNELVSASSSSATFTPNTSVPPITSFTLSPTASVKSAISAIPSASRSSIAAAESSAAAVIIHSDEYDCAYQNYGCNWMASDYESGGDYCGTSPFEAGPNLTDSHVVLAISKDSSGDCASKAGTQCGNALAATPCKVGEK
ncbi:uncharacterized protein N7469_002500 [Penicillium citrinum]|uniref:Uncharacterized protein n=1 Tax=Penicillium citrinum TaxID=5077 RepID=A0A9W9TVE9_PENCI|nr:uncharacterized protein N7469_002500 [Penicillium citrinum]KAJ5240909.1 hypothetical protein N7469_002500 [Penicillium citrinum]